MTKTMSYLPYTGILVIGAALLLIQAGRIDAFALLLGELILAFAYVAAVIDFKIKRIPNGVVLTMLVAWAIAMAPYLFLDTSVATALLMDSALGFAIGGGMFLLVYLFSRKGLGGGDVKFMAVAGLYLGLNGVLPAILCGTVLAAIVGLALILMKKIGRKDPIPLAPFLYAGILITVFLR
ncbi:MAG: prepilin peptidase [Oscillospiraceae bacterium]|nr:prepilin peptidase [Oscillospiraceae bacterium]